MFWGIATLFFFYTVGETFGQTSTIDQHPSWARVPNDVCGVLRQELKSRIIGGTPARLGQFPWLARIGSQFQQGGKIYRMFKCGGALITKFYVLSAAHCGTDLNVVRLGEHEVGIKDCDKKGCAPPHQDIFIEKTFLNNYNAETFQNDIMLILLKSPAEFNDFVKPVCLPRDDVLKMDLVGKYFRLAGWGVTDNDEKKASKKLMYFSAPLLKPDECNKIYKRTLIDSQYCIGYGKGKDTCTGDSGGPVTRAVKMENGKQNFIFAIVSYGLATCGNGPGIYTKVISFLPWILDQIEK